jgi:hypothetical protein
VLYLFEILNLIIESISQVRHLDTTDKSELHKLQLLKDELGDHISRLLDRLFASVISNICVMRI